MRAHEGGREGDMCVQAASSAVPVRDRLLSNYLPPRRRSGRPRGLGRVHRFGGTGGVARGPHGTVIGCVIAWITFLGVRPSSGLLTWGAFALWLHRVETPAEKDSCFTT